MTSKFDPMYDYKELKEYKEWEVVKEKIKSKYPELLFDNTTKKITKEQRELWLSYIKELSDEIFTPDGVFQKLSWEMMGEVERLEQERRARGKLYAVSREHL